ncbi:hypothetical protein P691DRAFT_805563 [Macrolepiota fuliginosa MF-IS2]|uniref:Uncharacterized protein n=1 Tax=Macrolepiota fuliginosa MF-IS2 TaxID=1400762 RepID=A0A9P5XA03_9AGAR|nr:hypothetical protein P691DRAFT_805563 [Macrolepiota fuliginosa MF-IS2]
MYQQACHGYDSTIRIDNSHQNHVQWFNTAKAHSNLIAPEDKRQWHGGAHVISKNRILLYSTLANLAVNSSQH